MALTRILILSLFAAGLATGAPAAAQEPTITFVGGGWGHGVGMSQYGALGRGDAGHTAEEILAFYYDGTTVEDRTAEIVDALGDGLRVRLGPSAGAPRPTSATVSARDSALLTVEIGGQTFTDIGSSVTLTQAKQDPAGGIGDNAQWYWILQVDGDPTDICTGCVARTPIIRWPAGTIVDITDDLQPQGAHDAGSLHLVGQDIGTTDGFFVVLEIPIDDYLQGLDEVPASWPTETLRAQAIAGRSYAVAKAIQRRASGLSFDVYDSVSDQVYDGYEDTNGTLIEHPARTAAATDTSGMVVVYDNAIVRTFYTSSNGGYTAASEESFTTAEPFHIAKPDPFDAAIGTDGEPRNPFAFGEYRYRLADISRWLADYPYADLDVGTVQQILITEQPPSGRIDDALVTVEGTARTIEIRTAGGDPYGYRFYNALRLGCSNDVQSNGSDCVPPSSTNLRIITFTDISFTDYFYEPVIWMTLNELTTGTGPGLFSPEREITRAEVAAFLWRFADRPEVAETHGFDDVPPDIWYDMAVAWMKAEDITTGTSPTAFSPADTVTRAQLATFLWRFAGRPTAPVADQFTDVEPERFYTEAVDWMVAWDITTGTTPTTFSPEDPLTRGQIATFLWRLAGTPAAFAEGSVLPSTMRV